MRIAHDISRLVEGDLGASKGRTASTGVEATTTTTAAATSTVTETTTSTTAATAASETTATATTSTEATTATLTRGALTSKVETDSTGHTSVANGSTVQLSEHSLGVLNGVEGDIAEALGAAIIGVGGQTDAGNLADLTEEVADGVLVNVERKVTNEECVALGADAVTVLLGTIVGTIARGRVSRLSIGVVEVNGATLNLLALHSLVRLGARLRVIEIDVAEAAAATRKLVTDNTGANEAAELLESLVQNSVVDAPAQAAGEEGGRLISLGLLGGGINLLISLALLGRRGSDLGLSVRSLLRVVAILIAIFLAVGALVRILRVILGVIGILVHFVRLLVIRKMGETRVRTLEVSFLALPFTALAAAGFSSASSSEESEESEESDDSAAGLALVPLALGLAVSSSDSEAESESDSESEDSSFLATLALPLVAAFLGASASDSEESELSASDSLAESSDSDSEDSGSGAFLDFLDFLSSLESLSAAALASSLLLALGVWAGLVTPALLVVTGAAAAFLDSLVLVLAILRSG